MAEGEAELEKAVRESENAADETGEDVTVIDPIRIQMLFGDKIYLSQTKISTFAGCPYKYWCRYVLELREKQVSSVSYNNSGTIVHYVLEKFIAEVKDTDGSLNIPEDDRVVELVNGYVDEYVRRIGCPLTPSMMYTFSRLRDLALIMVKSVIDEFSDSRFKVLSQEMRISERAEGALKPLEIKVNEGDEDSPKVILGGIIDRVDYYDGDDRRYLRVVDYKTGSHPFSLEGIETGEDVQLPAYLFTAVLDENRPVIGGEMEIFPASALFLSANESGGKVSPERSGFILDDIDVLRAASGELDKSILAGIVVDKGTGEVTKGNAVSEEEIKKIDTDLRRSIAETGRSIFAGNAPRTPSPSACKYCFLRSTCPVASKKSGF